MKNLSKAEEMVLLAIWRLRDNAYGVKIRKKIFETSGKDYTYGTLYGLLDQLVVKEYVKKIKGEPTKQRGGKSKTFYELTPAAIQALKDAIKTHEQVWQGIDEFSFDEI